MSVLKDGSTWLMNCWPRAHAQRDSRITLLRSIRLSDRSKSCRGSWLLWRAHCADHLVAAGIDQRERLRQSVNRIRREYTRHYVALERWGAGQRIFLSAAERAESVRDQSRHRLHDGTRTVRGHVPQLRTWRWR